MLIRGARATRKFAASLAKKILAQQSSSARVFGLVGDLGAGKTTFVGGFARALGIRARVTSSTFVMMKKYRVPAHSATLIHIDAYRIRTKKDLAALQFSTLLRDPKNIILIEWADAIKSSLPRRTRWIHFKHGVSLKERHIDILV